MFENILTKGTISFKDLEEIAFKIACEFANEILRNMFYKYLLFCGQIFIFMIEYDELNIK